MTIRLRKWSEEAAQREGEKRLAKIEAMLVDIGGLWGDVDQYIVGQVDDLLTHVRELKSDIAESIMARAYEDSQPQSEPRE